MSLDNEIQVYDGVGEIEVSKGDKIIKLSPENSQQIIAGMIGLGSDLISEAGKVTIDYFKTQSEMYSKELDAYMNNQSLKSDERKKMLDAIQNLITEYARLINETEDTEKQDRLKDTCNFFYQKYEKLYNNALVLEPIPKRDLLSGLKSLFKHG